jgi:hypothetical protein
VYDHAVRQQPPPRTAGDDSSPGDKLSSQEYAARGIEAWSMYLGDDDRAAREVAQDIRQRALELGRVKYGTFLYPDNGRDSLVDTYQELLDGVGYAANEARSTEDGALGRDAVELLRELFTLTVMCKRLLLRKERSRDRPAAAVLLERDGSVTSEAAIIAKLKAIGEGAKP